MIRPDETGTYPSQDLEWQDLDTALLVVVVSPLGEVRMWAEDTTALPAHAAMLRSFANRLDPPPVSCREAHPDRPHDVGFMPTPERPCQYR